MSNLFHDLFDGVPDPTKAELADLDAVTMLRLLRRSGKDDIARFGQDVRVPVGRKNLNERDADRLLAGLRNQEERFRLQAVRWLTADMPDQLLHALLERLGMETADGESLDGALDGLLEEWGPAVLRLALLASHSRPHLGERLIAAAIVEGTLIAEDWRDAADKLAAAAQELVDENLEAIEVHRAVPDDDCDADGCADTDDLEGDVEAELADDTGADTPAVDDPDDDGPGLGLGNTASPAGADVLAGNPSAAAGTAPTLTARSPAVDTDGPADALQALAAAVSAARAALPALQAGGPLSALAGLAAADGTVASAVSEQLDAARALAAEATVDSDEGRFLLALAELIGLGDPGDRMAAGMGLLDGPVGGEFAALLMAAAAGRITLVPEPAPAPELAEWAALLDGGVFDRLVAEWGTGSRRADPVPSDTVPSDTVRPGTGPSGDDGLVGTAGEAGEGAARSAPAGSPATLESAGEAAHGTPESCDLVPRSSEHGATPEGVTDGDTSDQRASSGQDDTSEDDTSEGSADQAGTSEEAAYDDPPDQGTLDRDVTGPDGTEPRTVEDGANTGDSEMPGAEPAGTTQTAGAADDADGAGTAAPAVQITGGQPRTPVDPETFDDLDLDDGGADDSDDMAPAGAGPEVWAGVLAGCRWSLGVYMARAEDRTGRADALEAVAIIDTLRSGTGLAANALYDLCPTLEPGAIVGDTPMQLVALLAAMRASLVAPFSGAIRPLGYLSSIFSDTAPQLGALAEAAITAAESGLALADIVTVPADDTARAAAADTASEWLSRPRHTNFERADMIWESLSGPKGMIGELLQPVAADDTSAFYAVRKAIGAISPNRVESELRSKDNEVRHGGAKRLQGQAKTTLQRWCDEAVRLAAAWVRAAEASAVTPANADARQRSALDQLRHAVSAHRTAALADLERLAGDDSRELAGAALGARHLLATTLALIDGVPLPGTELPPVLAQRVDLLRTSISLDAHGEPARPGDLTAEVVADIAGTWAEAFERRCAVGDHVGSAEVIELIRPNQPEVADTLAVRRVALLESARAERKNRQERLQADLDAGRRNGLVDETYAAAIQSHLLAADKPDRLDLGVVAAELDDVTASLREAAIDARDRFAQRLDAERRKRPEVAEAVFRSAATLAEQGDLATAEEILIQGLPFGEHRADVDFSEFFPAVVDDLADGISTEVVEAVASRGRHGSLDFAGLSPDAATSAAAALSQWRTVATGPRRTDLRSDLAPALRLLGIGMKGDRTVPNLPRSPERSWLDLTGVDRTGQRLVPAFGSGAGAEQRLLLVWRQPQPETLLSYLEQDPSEKAVIVLYFGTMPAAARLDLASRLRRNPTKTMVVVDDAVLAWAAAVGAGTFEVMMRATLPFSALNPYQTGHGGSVPEEMFYGRVAERQAVIAEAGTNLIYGGRRLGKSALLHEAGRRFEETPGQVAVYVDLDPAAIRATRRAEALWDLVAPKLEARGITAPRPTSRRRMSSQETVDAAVRAWLSAHPGGRMLLLVDECDGFFDADGANGFTVTRALKEMMERDRRFKVVFAGLHQVQRFAAIPNQPFAHLGKSVPIGPLAPSYGYNLLAKPLLALGWELSPELAARVLAYTNYLPILLQEVGHALVAELQRQPCVGPLPAKVTAGDIEKVLSSESLKLAIHDRFTLTLNLDPRYTVIAYVVALEALDEGVERTVAVRELRSRCSSYWPAGFADVREDEFRSLLEELVGLGILVRAGNAYRMRSPNVLRLLGAREDIEDKLLDVAGGGDEPSTFAAGDSHRVLDLATGEHSPLTEAQIADVVGAGENQMRVVVGSDAVGVAAVAATLAAVERDTATFKLRQPTTPAQYVRQLQTVPERTHHVVLDDVRGVNDDSLRKALVAPASRLPATVGASRSAVLLITPAQLAVVESVLGDDTAEVVVPLGRYSEAGVRTWALDVEGGFSDPAAVRHVLEVTGGWPVLLDRLAAAGRARGAAAALGDLRAELAADPSILLDPLGLADDGLLVSTFASLVDLLDGGGADAETVASLLEPYGAVSAAVALEACVAAGLLVETVTGARGHAGRKGDVLGVRHLVTEPVVTACWKAAHPA